MRHTVICGLPRSTRFFPHYLINGTIFEEKNIDHKMFVLISSETFFILGGTERDIIKNVYWSSCEVPVVIDRF
jgi:hypothetical protein